MICGDKWMLSNAASGANAPLETVDKAEIIDDLPPHIAEVHEDFVRCPVCDQLYWRGSHYRRLQAKIAQILKR